MITVIFQLAGVVFFFLGTLYLGLKIRKKSNQQEAINTSRISHFLFYTCLVIPGTLAIFYPGLTHFDTILGLSSLPLKSVFFIVGISVLLAGLFFMVSSIKSLGNTGGGRPAFIVTDRIVSKKLYEKTRNPMSLGYYMVGVGLALIATSTWLLIFTVLLFIPVHIFNLIYFEEKELETRFGDDYQAYKKRVPFLIPGLKN